jgi:hypothetical protein
MAHYQLPHFFLQKMRMAKPGDLWIGWKSRQLSSVLSVVPKEYIVTVYATWKMVAQFKDGCVKIVVSGLATQSSFLLLNA